MCVYSYIFGESNSLNPQDWSNTNDVESEQFSNINQDDNHCTKDRLCKHTLVLYKGSGIGALGSL